jgi:hypothetical protein
MGYIEQELEMYPVMNTNDDQEVRAAVQEMKPTGEIAVAE